LKPFYAKAEASASLGSFYQSHIRQWPSDSLTNIDMFYYYTGSVAYMRAVIDSTELADQRFVILLRRIHDFESYASIHSFINSDRNAILG